MISVQSVKMIIESQQQEQWPVVLELLKLHNASIKEGRLQLHSRGAQLESSWFLLQISAYSALSFGFFDLLGLNVCVQFRLGAF